MGNKHCPICGSESWAYDIAEYGTGWTFCNNCYQSAKESNLFAKIDKAIQEAREHHNATIFVEVK
jgi:uncharacterized Zn finger protein (UPF0148 family)